MNLASLKRSSLQRFAALLATLVLAATWPRGVLGGSCTLPTCTDIEIDSWSVTDYSSKVDFGFIPTCTNAEASRFFRATVVDETGASVDDGQYDLNDDLDDMYVSSAYSHVELGALETEQTFTVSVSNSSPKQLHVQLQRMKLADVYVASQANSKRSDLDGDCCASISDVLQEVDDEPDCDACEICGIVIADSNGHCSISDFLDISDNRCYGYDQMQRLNTWFCRRKFLSNPYSSSVTYSDVQAELDAYEDSYGSHCTSCSCDHINNCKADDIFSATYNGDKYYVKDDQSCRSVTAPETLTDFEGGSDDEFKYVHYVGPDSPSTTDYVDAVYVDAEQTVCTLCEENEFGLIIYIYIAKEAFASQAYFHYSIESLEEDYSFSSDLPFDSVDDLPAVADTNELVTTLSDYNSANERFEITHDEAIPLGQYKVTINRINPSHVVTQRYLGTTHCSSNSDCVSPLLECSSASPRACDTTGDAPSSEYEGDGDEPAAWSVTKNADCQCSGVTMDDVMLFDGTVEFEFDDAFLCSYEYRICDSLEDTETCKTGRQTEPRSSCGSREVSDINTRFDLSSLSAGTNRVYTTTFQDSTEEEYEQTLVVETAVAFRTQVDLTITSSSEAPSRDRTVCAELVDGSPFLDGTVYTGTTDDLGQVSFEILANLDYDEDRTDDEIHELQSRTVELRIDSGTRAVKYWYDECQDHVLSAVLTEHHFNYLPDYTLAASDDEVYLLQCTASSPCAHYEGECNGNDDACEGDLVCVSGIGLFYTDVSAVLASSLAEQMRIGLCLEDGVDLGTPSYCDSSSCAITEGPCTSSDDCAGDRVCIESISQWFGYGDSDMNVCGCTRDEHCASGKECSHGMCTCASSSNCESGEECEVPNITDFVSDADDRCQPSSSRKRSVSRRRERRAVKLHNATVANVSAATVPQEHRHVLAKRSLSVDTDDLIELSEFMCEQFAMCPRNDIDCDGIMEEVTTAPSEFLSDVGLSLVINEQTTFCVDQSNRLACLSGDANTCEVYGPCVGDDSCSGDNTCVSLIYSEDVTQLGVCVPPTAGARCDQSNDAVLNKCADDNMRCVVPSHLSGSTTLGACELIGHWRYCTESECDAYEGHCTDDTQCSGDLVCTAGAYEDLYAHLTPSDGSAYEFADIQLCLEACDDTTGLCGSPRGTDNVCAPSLGRVTAYLSEEAAAEHGLTEGDLYCMDETHVDYCFNAGVECGVGGRCTERLDCETALTCVDGACAEASSVDSCSSASPCGEYGTICESDEECDGDLECRSGYFDHVFGADGYFVDADYESMASVGVCLYNEEMCTTYGVCGRPFSADTLECTEEAHDVVTLNADVIANLGLDATYTQYCIDTEHSHSCLNDASQLCGSDGACYTDADCDNELICHTSDFVCIGVGHDDFCVLQECEAGQGPCDDDTQCAGDAECKTNVAEYYFGEEEGVDPPLISSQGMCVGAADFGSDAYCSTYGVCSTVDDNDECDNSWVAASVRTSVRAVVTPIDEVLDPASRLATSDELLYCVDESHDDYCVLVGCDAGDSCADADGGILACDEELMCIDDVCTEYSEDEALTFCDTRLCGPGEGHCTDDAQCEPGLSCVADVGDYVESADYTIALCVNLTCVIEVDVTHGKTFGQSSTDLSTVGVHGRVVFEAAPGNADVLCWPSDVLVTVYDRDEESGEQGDSYDDIEVDAHGRFTLAVPQKTTVVLELTRTVAPEYTYTAQRVEFETSTTDYYLDTLTITDTAELVLRIHGGACQYPVSLQPTLLAIKSPQCDSNTAFTLTSDMETSDYVRFSTSGLPPLEYTLDTIELSDADVEDDVTSAGSRTFDLQLPAISLTQSITSDQEGEDAEATNVAASGLKPSVTLSNDVILALAFDTTSFLDLSGNDHNVEVVDSDEADDLLAYADDDGQLGTGALVVSETSVSGITLGYNYFAELASSSTERGTISLWFRADLPEESDAYITLIKAYKTSGSNSYGYKVILERYTESGERKFLLRVVIREYETTKVVELGERDDWHHFMLIVDDTSLTLCFDGDCDDTLDGVVEVPVHGDTFAACAMSSTPWECGEETIIGEVVTTSDTFGLDSGNGRLLIDDLVIWSEALATSDAAFIYTAGLDEWALCGDSSNGTLLNVVEPFEYRTSAQVSVPLDRAIYYAPLETTSSNSEFSHGDAQYFSETSRVTECDVAKQEVRSLHVVETGSAVTFVAVAREVYTDAVTGESLVCPMVTGNVYIISSFTGACSIDPQRVEEDTDDQLVCEGQLEASSFGQIAFWGIVGAPVQLILEDSSDLTVDSSLDLDEPATSADEYDPYLGKLTFAFRKEAVDDYVYGYAWFVIEGTTVPEAAAVYSVPVGDVPLVRLYRPPGDESKSVIERQWMRSISLKWETTDESTATGHLGANLDVKLGDDGSVCFGVGAVKCSKFAIEGTFNAYYTYEVQVQDTHEISIDKMWSREEMLVFETVANHKAIGKYGDMVVTIGFDLLVTESFLVSFDSDTCTINQEYRPTWTPQAQDIETSLQLHTFYTMPSVIEKFQTLRSLASELCDPVLTDDAPTCQALVDEDGDDTITSATYKYANARDAVERWATIMANLIDVRDGARLMSGFERDEEYDEESEREVYELPDALSDDELIAQTEPIDLFRLPRIIQDDTLDSEEDDDLLSTANTVRVDLFEDTDAYSDGASCKNSDETCITLQNRTDSVFSARSFPEDDVVSIHFQGGTSVAYTSMASVSASDTYTFSTRVVSSHEFGDSLGVDFRYIIIGVSFTVSANLKFETATETRRGVGRETSDVVTTAFVLSDDDPGDEFGVNIFADPVYGTPVFIVTGGYSRCPAEPYTTPREELVGYPSGTQYLVIRDPDESAVIDFRGRLATTREFDANGEQFVFMFQVYYEQDLQVDYKGELVDIGGRLEVQLTNSELRSFGPITVKRGASYKYEGVRFALTSSCDDGVETYQAVDTEVYYNIEWQERCAALQIDTDREDLEATNLFGVTYMREGFVVNQYTDNWIIPVKNPNGIMPWRRQGTFRIGVQWRVIGEQGDWNEAAVAYYDGSQETQRYLSFCDPNEEDEFDAYSCHYDCPTETDEDGDVTKDECCYSYGITCTDASECCGSQNVYTSSASFEMDCLEDPDDEDGRLQCTLVDTVARGGEGGALAFNETDVVLDSTDEWLLTGSDAIVEGEVEMRLFTECGDSEDGETYFYSDEVSGRVDRVAPRAFGGQQEPADGIWWPGDRVALRFVEEMDCRRPFSFTVTVTATTDVDDPDASVDLSDDVSVLCKYDTIELRFEAAFLATDSDARYVTVSVSGATDLALNEQETDTIEWSFVIGEFSGSQLSVSLDDVHVHVPADEPLNETALVEALFDSDGPLNNVYVSTTLRRRRRKRSDGVDNGDHDVHVQVHGGTGAHHTAESRVARISMPAGPDTLELARRAVRRLRDARRSGAHMLVSSKRDAHLAPRGTLHGIVLDAPLIVALQTSERRHAPAPPPTSTVALFGDDRLLVMCILVTALCLGCLAVLVSLYNAHMMRVLRNTMQGAGAASAKQPLRARSSDWKANRSVSSLLTLVMLIGLCAVAVMADVPDHECPDEDDSPVLCTACDECAGSFVEASSAAELETLLADGTTMCISMTDDVFTLPTATSDNVVLAVKCLHVGPGSTLTLEDTYDFGRYYSTSFADESDDGTCVYVSDGGTLDASTRTLVLRAEAQGVASMALQVESGGTAHFANVQGEALDWSVIVYGSSSSLTVDGSMDLLSMTADADHNSHLFCVGDGATVSVGDIEMRSFGASTNLVVQDADSELEITGTGLALRGGSDTIVVGSGATVTAVLLDLGNGDDELYCAGELSGAGVLGTQGEHTCTQEVSGSVSGGIDLLLACPTAAPTLQPTDAPTTTPTQQPTNAPTASPEPSSCYETAVFLLYPPYFLLLDEETAAEDVVNSGSAGGTATRIGTWTDSDVATSAEQGYYSNSFSSSPSRALYITGITVSAVRSSVSLLFWVRRPSATVTSDETVVMLGDMTASQKSVREDFGLYFSSLEARFMVSTAGFKIGDTATAVLEDGDWHFVALTASSSNGNNLYIDGSLEYSVSYPLYLATSGMELVVGGRGAGTSTAASQLELNGYVDGVALFTDVELSDTEVAALACS